jgi:hypothetical protein
MVMFTRTLTYLIIVLFLASPAAFPQTVALGTPPFGSFSGGPFDTVNNANLNVSFQVPIINKAGRGQNLNYTLSYDSSIWTPATSSGVTSWTPTTLTTWGWTAAANAPAAVIGSVLFQTTQNQCYGNNSWYYWTIYTGYEYDEPNGTPHPTPHAVSVAVSNYQTGAPCGSGPPSTASARTADGQYQVTVSTSPGSGYAWLNYAIKTNGTVLGLISGQSGSAQSQDSNGNQITASSSSGSIVITDTLGTTGLTVAPGSPMTLTYTNPQSYAQQRFMRRNQPGTRKRWSLRVECAS